MNQLQIISMFVSLYSSFRIRKRERVWSSLGHMCIPQQGRVRFPNWVHAAGEEKFPIGKSECWAGETTDPYYNTERSPVPSQMPSLVTLQWLVSAYSHISHTEPSEAEAEPQRTLSPSLSPCTRTASSSDSLHTSLLSHPPEHDIYGNLFHCFVLATTPSRPISFKLSSASAAMNIRTHPSVRGRKEFYLLPLPSLQRESAQPQSRYHRLSSNPLPTSVFFRMLSSTNQRGRKSAHKLCNWNRRANKNCPGSTQKPF